MAQVNLTDLAIGLVIIGIVTSIGAVVLIGVRDARLTSLDTYVTFNETATTVTDTVGEVLVNTWGKSVDIVTNVSGSVLNSANYTVGISDVTGKITITATSGSAANNSDWNVTYTAYNTSRGDWELADDAAIGLGEYGNWFKIIAIIGIAAVILALIFSSFTRGSFGDKGSPSLGY